MSPPAIDGQTPMECTFLQRSASSIFGERIDILLSRFLEAKDATAIGDPNTSSGQPTSNKAHYRIVVTAVGGSNDNVYGFMLAAVDAPNISPSVRLFRSTSKAKSQTLLAILPS
jgi:hypothetical protein